MIKSLICPLFLLAFGLACQAAEPRPVAPNILVIFIDDMGFADPSCFDGK